MPQPLPRNPLLQGGETSQPRARLTGPSGVMMVSPFLPVLTKGWSSRAQAGNARGVGAGYLKAGCGISTGNLGESVLLPFRLPVPRLHHPGGVLFANQHRHGILPAVCRGEGNGASSLGWGQLGPVLNWISEAVWVSHVVLPLLAMRSWASTSLPLAKPPFVQL